jgi:uncharacterized iron-regulated membrane protein
VAAAATLYPRIWRWHFYSALIVIPFVLWQGTTGLLYLWHQELADALWPRLTQGASGVSGTSLDAQVAAARAVLPEASLRSITLPAEAGRATAIVFDAGGLKQPVFVDPATGAVLGSVSPTAWLPGLSRALHGGWPLGQAGSLLLELGACWAIVMILTGLYLWWPRQARGYAGVLYPRWRAGSRVFWRDLHAVIGIYASGVVLAFLLTALPWTSFWGDRILRPLQQWSGQTSPPLFGHHGGGGAHAAAGGVEIPLERAVDRAREAGLSGTLEVSPRAGAAPMLVRSVAGRAALERAVLINRYTGVIERRIGWEDYKPIPRLIATGVDLHEGTFFGRANQWFNTLLVLALYGLVITAAIGWYRRRPGQGLGAPPRVDRPVSRGFLAGGVVLCVLLPLLGLSVALLWLLDRAGRRWHPA